VTGFLCGAGRPDFDWPDAGNGMCCVGAAMGGPESCTCWEPVYDLVQAEPGDETPAPGVRADPCDDCAYRPDSPERRGEPHVRGDEAMLQSIVETGQPFWCHQGMRRPVAYVHPSGARVVPSGIEAAYAPPDHGGIPLRADGTPADICHGWFNRRLRHVQEAR
jgi:hypothetical protein